MLRDHKPITLSEFNGLWARGDAEACPPDHFIKANNLQYIQGGFKTRDPIDPYQVLGAKVSNILRVYTYMMQTGESLLVLTTGGNIYHVIGPSTVYGPILTIPAMTDFGFQAIAGRAYITPFASSVNSFGVNTEIGLQNEFMYVYAGNGIHARKAGGFPPSNGSLKPLIAYNTDDAGVVTAGTHAIAVAYITNKVGLLGPEVFAVVFAPGDKQVQLTNIPIGPVGTTGRLIAMTKAVDIATVTDTKTKTYSWTGGIDYWSDNGGGSLPFSYDGANAVKFAKTGIGIGDNVEGRGISEDLITWEDFGVPIGATVVSVQMTAWKRNIVTSTNIATDVLTASMVASDGVTNICNGNNLGVVSLPTSSGGGFTSMTPGAVVAVDGTYGPSNTVVRLLFDLSVDAGSGLGSVDTRLDDVTLTITYTQRITSLYSGDSSIFDYYDLFTITDNVTTSCKINIADSSLNLIHTPDVTPPASPVTNALLVQNVDEDGHCDPGLHLIGVVFETNTGFLTAPGPEYFGAQTFIDPTKKVKISNIPTSTDPAVVKRHLVSTIAIAGYNGNQAEYQFFFIPYATLNDNTTTEWTGSFFDSDLVSDASHLSDNFSEIPAFAGLTTYHGRLVGYGEYNNISVARISAPGEPEAISQVDGLLIAPLDGYPLTNAQEYRDILYLFKRSKTIGYSDNGDVPSSWTPNVVDQGIGASIHGIITILDSGGVNIDFLLVIDYSGIMMFNGIYARPELSWKIGDLWSGLDKNAYRYIQGVNDPISKKIWITLPPPYQKKLIHLDYNNGLDPQSIRFSTWEFGRAVQSITLTDMNKLILGGDGLLRVSPDKIDRRDTYYDKSEAIPIPLFRTAYSVGDDNLIHFTAARIRVVGVGNLQLKLYTLDDVRSLTLTPLPMTGVAEVTPTRLCNFTSQRASLEGWTDKVDEIFKINRITVFVREVASSIPG